MRAILIDPEKRTVSEIQMVNGDYREINGVLRCRSFTISAYLNGSFADGFDAVMVSDDEIEALPEDDRRFWFQVDADKDPPSSYPICGNGLVLGTDTDGASCGASISVDEVAKRITFTKRKFRGYSITTSDTAPSHVKVEVDTLVIIDGEEVGS